MPDRNPFIPSERVRDRKESTTINQTESKEMYRRQRANEKRDAREHPEPEELEDDETAHKKQRAQNDEEE